ncbi:MAG: hypothetical protein HDS66_01535 [Bacteroidales bacterium]|nr:hypothetical protein [Bacteroidales bacterium]
MRINITNRYTEIYGGGKWITQSAPTNFHQFWERKMLDVTENPEDFKEVSNSEKEAIEKSDAEWQSPPQSIIDVWDQVWGENGRYNKGTGYFEAHLSGPAPILDITYSQALSIIDAGRLTGDNAAYRYANNDNLRTAIPRAGTPTLRANQTFISCHNIEVVDASKLKAGVMTFYGCHKLHAIINMDSINDDIISQGCFPTHDGLTTLYGGIQGTYPTIDLRHYSRLSIDSFRYIITHKAEKVMNITHTLIVHPDIYAKITDADNEEWHTLMYLAQENNIIFATI